MVILIIISVLWVCWVFFFFLLGRFSRKVLVMMSMMLSYCSFMGSLCSRMVLEIVVKIGVNESIGIVVVSLLIWMECRNNRFVVILRMMLLRVGIR